MPMAMGDRVTRIRKALRRAVHRLPDREQLLIRRATAALRRPDWADAVGRLRGAESAFIDDTAATAQRQPGRRRVLVCVLQQFPPVAEVSYSLAMAMRLRGHDVTGILCDGVLPMCEMNLGHLDRPSCGVCATWASRYEASFGFSFARLTALLTPDDRDRAEALVAATPEGALVSLVVDGVPVGMLARRELQRYHRGFVTEPERDPAYRSWLVSGVLLVQLAARLFDRERPDVLLISSG